MEGEHHEIGQKHCTLAALLLKCASRPMFRLPARTGDEMRSARKSRPDIGVRVATPSSIGHTFCAMVYFSSRMTHPCGPKA